MQCSKALTPHRRQDRYFLLTAQRLTALQQRNKAMLTVNIISKRLRNWTRYRTTVRSSRSSPTVT